MLCQICKKKKAGIVLYRIINGKKTEINICEECAALFTNKLPSLTLSQFNINNLLIGLLSVIDFYGKDEDVFINKELKCANCQLTYEEFRQTGKLGCSQCYWYFKNKLKPLFIKLQRNYHHKRKIPHKIKDIVNKLSEVSRLKKELNETVYREDYEKTAKIRDKIIQYERSKNQQRIDRKEKILKNLIKSKANWINGKGSLSDVVVSSRIRCARNINNIPFTSRANKMELEKVSKIVQKVFNENTISAILIISC